MFAFENFSSLCETRVPVGNPLSPGGTVVATCPIWQVSGAVVVVTCGDAYDDAGQTEGQIDHQQHGSAAKTSETSTTCMHLYEAVMVNGGSRRYVMSDKHHIHTYEAVMVNGGSRRYVMSDKRSPRVLCS